MVRRAILAMFLAAFCLSLGCDGGSTKETNSGNLPFSNEGPPERDGVKTGVKSGKKK